MMCFRPAATMIVSLLLLLATATGTLAHASKADRSPHWSLEVKGGKFTPELEDWDKYYGSDDMTYLAIGFGYKFLRQLELGAELGYMEDRGKGYLPSNGELGGNVTYNLNPLHTYVIFRGVFNERQWVVPYIGGGWTFSYYKQSVSNQGDSSGWANGYNGRVGLQLLLNRIEPSAASFARKETGLQNTYLYLEAQKFSSKKDGYELGGTSYLLGVLFEF